VFAEPAEITRVVQRLFLRLAQILQELAQGAEGDQQDDQPRPAGRAEAVHLDVAVELETERISQSRDRQPDADLEPLAGA
jgi:hypothetical protein